MKQRLIRLGSNDMIPNKKKWRLSILLTVIAGVFLVAGSSGAKSPPLPA
jgi:hypothetical protein